MTISAVYTPAPGEDPEELGPNEFTAGSELTLNCTVQGHSGALTYTWSVTPDCTGCNIDTSSIAPTLTVGLPELYSYFAGVYTCNVIEIGRPDSGNIDTFIVTVLGMFVCIIIV